jgi:hypothetical protein
MILDLASYFVGMISAFILILIIGFGIWLRKKQETK